MSADRTGIWPGHVSPLEFATLLRTIGAEHEEAAIFRTAVEGLTHTFAASQVSIFFRTETEAVMSLCAALPPARTAGTIPDDHPLIAALTAERKKGRGGLVFSQTFRTPNETTPLHDLGFELAVPMWIEGQLAGILLIGRPLLTPDDSDGVLSLLDAVGMQLAVSIATRRLERRTKHYEKLIALGTLAAGLGHELRNPLTSINTFVSLVEAGSNPTDDASFVKVIARDTRRIASIIENVSAFATNGQVAMGPVDLHDVLQSSVEIATGDSIGSKIQVTLQCRMQSPISGNAGQLEQVFVNLIQNAVQAIGTARGKIEIVVEAAALASGAPGACVIVRDTGPGVGPEVLHRIFEPFVTTKGSAARNGKRGLGLGLAIVKQIIDAHRGDIRVESTVGKGTEFFVRLPAAPAK
jgi:two-component system, NtrC family, sensor histidine kinase HydH